MSERKRIGLLSVLALLVYVNSLGGDFTFDDHVYIFRNPGVIGRSVKALFQPMKLGSNPFRPVTFGTFAINHRIGGEQSAGYHVVNLLLHAAVVVLLYLVLRKLLEAIPKGDIVSFAAALLFAVHPIHSEAVASITGRSELLAAGFLLGGWLLHLEDRPVASLLLFGLGLLSKESAVVFLPLVLAGDYARGKFKPLLHYGGIAGLTAAYMAVLWVVLGGTFAKGPYHPIDNPLANLPAKLRVLNALRVAWKYVALQAYPRTLSCDYSYNTITLYSNWKHLAPALIGTLAVLAALGWAMWKKRNGWFLAGALYVVAFAVTSNVLVSTGTIMGERLAYLPSAGFCLAVALVWIHWERRNRTLAWVMIGVVVTGLGARTLARNRDWHDDFTLFSRDVEVTPRSAKIHGNLGIEYFHRGDMAKAQGEFRTALEIFPDFAGAVEWLGLTDSEMGNDEEAKRLLLRGLSLTQKDDMDYDLRSVNLAAQLIKMGDNSTALGILNESIQKSPRFSRAWSNRAVVHYRQGDLQAAREDAEVALRLDAENAQALNLLNALNATSAPASFPARH